MIEEVSRYAGAKTQVINVAGRTVIPGLIDNHPSTCAADTWHRQARSKASTRAEKRSRFLRPRPLARRSATGSSGAGRLDTATVRRRAGGFTLEELDQAAPRNPLFVQEGYSVVYANSLALKAVGLNPAEGARRNAAGLASFQPPAKLLDAIRKRSPAQREQNLTDFLHALNAAGLTGVYSLGQSAFLAARAAKGPLPVRLWETLAFNATDPVSATKAAALIERSRPNQFDGNFGMFGLGEVLYGPFFDLARRRSPGRPRS